MPRSRIPERFINLEYIFSVKNILLARGYEVVKEENYNDLIIPECDHDDEIWEDIFEIYLNLKSRQELKSFIYSEIKVQEIKNINVKKLVENHNFKKSRSKFDNTFEWFIGKLMVKKFGAFSFSRGVTIKNIIRNSTKTDSGDFDTLAVLRNMQLAYFECKAGSFDKQAILKCYDRMLSTNSEFSILISLEKINEKDLIWISENLKIPTQGQHSLHRLSLKGKKDRSLKETDIVYDFHNCYIIGGFGIF